LLAPELPPEGVELDRWLDGLAWSLLDQAVERAGGNRAAAARLLGMQRTTLVMRLHAAREQAPHE
jgi:DNA-binding NtrC family response regulator